MQSIPFGIFRIAIQAQKLEDLFDDLRIREETINMRSRIIKQQILYKLFFSYQVSINNIVSQAFHFLFLFLLSLSSSLVLFTQARLLDFLLILLCEANTINLASPTSPARLFTLQHTQALLHELG